MISNLWAWGQQLGLAGHRIKRDDDGRAEPDIYTAERWTFTCLACGRTYKSDHNYEMPEIAPCPGEKT